MLIVCLIELVILAHLGYELFELLDFQPVLERLVSDLPHLGWQVWLLELLTGHRDAFLIELKESFNELQEEKIVVIDERGETGLGVESGAARMSLISDFIT